MYHSKLPLDRGLIPSTLIIGWTLEKYYNVLVTKPRKIMHLDLDAFYCSVEELKDPSLHGKPFAVGGQPGSRGVVASCSYAARAYGVRSAMPMSRALKLCPQLMVVRGSYHDYSDYSDQVMERLNDLTPLVEQISIDEAFLDVSDLPEPGLILAHRLQVRINSELHLPCSIGVATNKLVAKIATDEGKRKARSGEPPNAVEVVPPGSEADYLAPLPVQAIWGIGPKTTARLNAMQVETIRDLTRLSESELAGIFGKYGSEMHMRARGIDHSPVVVEHEVKSISQEVTFDKDIADRKSLTDTLRSLSDQVAYRLRRAGLCAGVVRLKLRWPDFTTLTRQVSLPQPTDQDSMIYAAIIDLFDKVWERGKAVRLVGVGASGLGPPERQPGLFDAGDEKERRLHQAMDALREKYGDKVVQRASRLKRQRQR